MKKSLVERYERAREEREEKKRFKVAGDNYEKMRKLESKPPTFLSREKPNKKKDLLVTVDVNVAPGK